MRIIDQEDWPRREHFRFYGSFDQPHFNISAPVDITELRSALRDRGVSFTAGWLYVLMRALNGIPEFRQRIRGGVVVEHEAVHPAFTVMGDGDVFGFCFVEYGDGFEDFCERAVQQIAAARACPSLEEDPRDDVVFMTAIPWLSFTGFVHPLPTTPPDSIPRIAWGRFYHQDGRLLMPLNVQGHHALFDGVHVGRLFEGVTVLQGRLGDIMGPPNEGDRGRRS